MADKPDKQQEKIKQFQKFGFVAGNKTKTGAVLLELRGTDPVRILVEPDGAVLHISGDVTRFDWSKFNKR